MRRMAAYATRRAKTGKTCGPSYGLLRKRCAVLSIGDASRAHHVWMLLSGSAPLHCRFMANKEKERAASAAGGDDVENVADGLEAIAAQAQELPNRLRGVRGTRRITPPAAALPAGRQPVDPELLARVRKMLESDPMRLTQIVEATGENENKIKVLITKMQREGVRIVNLGARNKALWFIPTGKALQRLEHAAADED